MEGPALLGIPTMYIEETGNKQAKRMEKWKGKVPGWTQMKVGTLPTRTGKRYQTPKTRVPAMEKEVEDAIGGVMTATADSRPFVLGVLYPNYNETETVFLGNVKTHLKITRDLKPDIAAALKVWHGAFKKHKIVLDKLVIAEKLVVTETGKADTVVAGALREGGADNVNTGLADYMRIVLPKLQPAKGEAKKGSDAEKLEAEKAEAAKLETIKKSIRQWRAIYVGKEDLAKGFTGQDLNQLLYSQTLRADTFEHVRATKTVLMNRIDALAGERANTVSGRLENLEWAAPDQFVKNYILNCAFPLKTKLGLKGPRETRESVQARVIEHGQTREGSVWWNEFDAKLKELRVAIWPDMR
jgi:hypothetical protein